MKKAYFTGLVAITAIAIYSLTVVMSGGVFAQETQTTLVWNQLYEHGFVYPGVGPFHQGGTDGSFHADKATADKVCQLRGFSASTSFITDNYTSCGDNYYYQWTGSSWTQFNACQSNLQLQTLYCATLPVCVSHNSKACYNNDVYWYDSCNIRQDLFKTCLSGQFCSNGDCQSYTCSTNSNCGIDGFIGDNFCNGNNVYRKYKTYTCSNPATANSSCSSIIEDRLVTTCSGNTTCNNGACTGNSVLPVIDFRANGSTGSISIAYNTGVTLTWTTTGATSCTASGDWSGSKATSGSEFVGYLTQNKTYILTCTGQGGTTVSTVAANVSGQSQVPVIDFKINGSSGSISIVYNTGVTLTWTSTGATSCTASGDWSGSKATSGSEFVGYLTQNKTYILTCTGTGGTTISTVSANISGQSHAPTVDLKINGSDGSITLPTNSIATLTWTSTNATSCYASGNWYGTKAIVGSETTGVINYSATYTLVCTNNYGSTTDSVNVTSGQQQQYPCYYGSQCQLPCYSSQCQSLCTQNYGYSQPCQNYQYQISQYTNPVVYPSYSNLTLLKQGRNLSKGVNALSDVIVADPNDIVIFQITVQNSSSNYLQSAVVRDVLPSRAIFNGSLVIDGSPIVGGDGGLFGSGISIGNLSPGQSKIISFQVRVADISQFPTGQTRLINEATVTSNGGTATDSAAICITRNLISGVSYGNIASYVSTGITDNPFVDIFLIPFILTLLIVLVFRSKMNQLFRKKIEDGSEAQELLAAKIEDIKKNEFGLD